MQPQKHSPRRLLHRLLSVCAALLLLSACQRPPDAASGTIEVDEVHVAPRIAGRVEKIFAREGERLVAGQVLVQLEAFELRARRDYVAAQLAELQQGPRVEEIEAAKQDWESQNAQLEFARADAKRSQDLLQTRTISPSEAQRTAANANALEKTAAAARQRYEMLREGTRPERLAQARAQLEEIDAQMREMQIVAPSDSVLEILSVKVGDVLPPNREVATLILPNYLWVRVYVPQPWLGHIQLGEEVRARADSFRDQEFKGTIEQINRQAEFTPRNVQTVEDRIRQVFGVKIRLENRDDKLRAGMSVDITFPNVPK
ncbi:MAG: efflux RND transporter periplasmic adaptor subunit [Verrucomicrobiota bacterium]|nr:efflux RND transporter periplasmic adaptor subunit [Verrucomicrobiota bacterium]